MLAPPPRSAPMSSKPTPITEPLYEYILAHSLREPEVLRELRERTASMKHGGMQISPDQGQFMRILARLIGPRRTLQSGVFTPYPPTTVPPPPPPDGPP